MGGVDKDGAVYIYDPTNMKYYSDKPGSQYTFDDYRAEGKDRRNYWMIRTYDKRINKEYAPPFPEESRQWLT